jgi:hypothetical protein
LHWRNGPLSRLHFRKCMSYCSLSLFCSHYWILQHKSWQQQFRRIKFPFRRLLRLAGLGWLYCTEVKVEVTLRQSVSQSVCLVIEHPCGTCDLILLPVRMLSEIFGLISVGRPLWREDGSAICSVITQWSESRRTRNHTLLSHLRLPQPGGQGYHIYIPQEQGLLYWESESESESLFDRQSVSRPVRLGVKPILGLFTRKLFSSEV